MFLLLAKYLTMKKIIVSFSLLIGMAAQAQMKEGKVVYERTMQMRRPGMSAEVAQVIPQERKDNFELLFGNNQSLWQVIPNPDGDQNTFSNGGMVIRMANNTDVTYFDFEKARRVDQREMFDREFLVEDSVQKLSWKLSEETKTILGHTARKATAIRIGTRTQMTMEKGEMKREQVADSSSIIAWFTTDIPVPAGPVEFQGQLPGLILELSVNNGRQVYKAVEVSPKVNLSNIKEPKGGKRLTVAEFNQEREKLMEEMRKNNPGGNRVIRMN